MGPTTPYTSRRHWFEVGTQSRTIRDLWLSVGAQDVLSTLTIDVCQRPTLRDNSQMSNTDETGWWELNKTEPDLSFFALGCFTLFLKRERGLVIVQTTKYTSKGSYYTLSTNVPCTFRSFVSVFSGFTSSSLFSVRSALSHVYTSIILMSFLSVWTRLEIFSQNLDPRG